MTGGGALVDGVEAAEEFLSESVLSPLCTCARSDWARHVCHGGGGKDGHADGEHIELPR